jgi:hypothetical protein
VPIPGLVCGTDAGALAALQAADPGYGTTCRPGDYVFPALNPGSYDITVTPPNGGVVSVLPAVATNLVRSGAGVGNTADGVALAPAIVMADVDFGLAVAGQDPDPEETDPTPTPTPDPTDPGPIDPTPDPTDPEPTDPEPTNPNPGPGPEVDSGGSLTDPAAQSLSGMLFGAAVIAAVLALVALGLAWLRARRARRSAD